MAFLIDLRLVPVIPFFMINLMAGLLKISVRTFTWTTALGILPVPFIFVYLGTGLHNVHSFADIFSPQMLTIFALMILIFCNAGYCDSLSCVYFALSHSLRARLISLKLSWSQRVPIVFGK